MSLYVTLFTDQVEPAFAHSSVPPEAKQLLPESLLAAKLYSWFGSNLVRSVDSLRPFGNSGVLSRCSPAVTAWDTAGGNCKQPHKQSSST